MQITTNQTFNINWRIKGAEHYGVTERGVVINMRTGRILRRVLIGTTEGYCINGKFKSVDRIEYELETIEELPF